ncbi:DUF378 domain-containing protein [Cytobacillus sp. FSL R7-0696]|uniref:DUF378 domain-containing protein n=1 Tax=Cytobacillus sp. FSL R7-0696 TaxID=2921691 RepID=UPI0030F90AF4
MKTLQRIALALVIIGAINWGLIGLFQFDLVATIFGGQDAILSRIVYTLVGISGLICLSLLFAPMTEEEDRDVDNRAIDGRQVSYSTEFAEENDLSDIKEEDRENRDQ